MRIISCLALLGVIAATPALADGFSAKDTPYAYREAPTSYRPGCSRRSSIRECLSPEELATLRRIKARAERRRLATIRKSRIVERYIDPRLARYGRVICRGSGRPCRED